MFVWLCKKYLNITCSDCPNTCVLSLESVCLHSPMQQFTVYIYYPSICVLCIPSVLRVCTLVFYFTRMICSRLGVMRIMYPLCMICPEPTFSFPTNSTSTRRIVFVDLFTPHFPRPGLPSSGRRDKGRREEGAAGDVHCPRLSLLLLPPQHQGRGSGSEPAGGRHCHHL